MDTYHKAKRYHRSNLLNGEPDRQTGVGPPWDEMSAGNKKTLHTALDGLQGMSPDKGRMSRFGHASKGGAASAQKVVELNVFLT